MAMTICHDLHGMTEGALAEAFVFELDAGSETRSKGVRESLRRGRLYLGNLGAWPWWGKTHWLHVPPAGTWPQRWWLNDAVLLVLAQWRTGLMTHSFHQALREAGVTDAPYPAAYEPAW
jgi:hypothetical protein